MTTSLQDYLKRYSSDVEIRKKKKKKPKLSKPAGAITIIDADPVWQKEVKEISSESEESQDDAPLVIKDVEVKRMQRLEALKMHRPYISTAEDGSGWVSVSSTSDRGTHDTHQGDGESSSPTRKHRFSETRSEELLPDKSAGSLDLSPPRKSFKVSKVEGSSLKADEEPDLSPPRERSLAARADRSSLSPPRRNLAADLSPPRKIHTSSRMSSLTRAGSPDISPPRKRSSAGRLSPPRRKIESHQSVSHDLSPPRKSVTMDSSPPRKRHISAESGSRIREDKKEVMADGTTAGLRTGKQLNKEITMKKEEDSRRFKEMDASITGRNATTVYRDKHGRRLESLDELLKLQQIEKEPKQDKPLEWGKGLAQRREQKEKLAELEAEKAKPFARTRDDPELDKMLKEEVRWGDPMAHLIKKKQTAGETMLVDLGASEQMKESGFIVPQMIPNHSWLKRNITAPPNRYNIKPGRHWDGVDRSTGYERDMYKRQNERKADEVEAYLWSVADM